LTAIELGWSVLFEASATGFAKTGVGTLCYRLFGANWTSVNTKPGIPACQIRTNVLK
jgi:hypothetical protein